MIELKALCGVLDSLGIPWANQRFADGEEPAPPFICLVAGYNESAYADNSTYLSWMPYDIALYTRHRDYATEKRIRDALEAAECPYTLGITEIDSEELTEAAFTVNVAES